MGVTAQNFASIREIQDFEKSFFYLGTMTVHHRNHLFDEILFFLPKNPNFLLRASAYYLTRIVSSKARYVYTQDREYSTGTRDPIFFLFSLQLPHPQKLATACVDSQ